MEVRGGRGRRARVGGGCRGEVAGVVGLQWWRVGEGTVEEKRGKKKIGDGRGRRRPGLLEKCSYPYSLPETVALPSVTGTREIPKNTRHRICRV